MPEMKVTRRAVLYGTAASLTGLPGVEAVGTRRSIATPNLPPGAETVDLALTVNGEPLQITVEPRTTLLDALRDTLGLDGTKKGCDMGSCGACTVHIDDKRVVSCLTLVARCEKKEIVTIEGLAAGEALHPMQAAFVRHDGFQCGYCTPGQIMSAVALLREGHAGSDDEIREWMSGNICRCGAYTNIVAAIKDAAGRTG